MVEMICWVCMGWCSRTNVVERRGGIYSEKERSFTERERASFLPTFFFPLYLFSFSFLLSSILSLMVGGITFPVIAENHIWKSFWFYLSIVSGADHLLIGVSSHIAFKKKKKLSSCRKSYIWNLIKNRGNYPCLLLVLLWPVWFLHQ
jgi:hypothetical protein